MRQGLWRIRKAFESSALRWEDYFEISDITVAFLPNSDYRLDAEVLLEISEGSPLAEIIEAVRLYRGELLPGFYDEWVVLERDRLQAAYSQKMDLLLERLIDLGQWDDVLSWGEEWIRKAISPEPAYRAMMIAHEKSGHPGMVGATYQRCLDALNRDLGLEPSPETTRLYQQIRRGELEEPTVPRKPVLESGNPHLSFFDQRQPIQIEKPIFVARERELEKMGRLLDLALKGQGRVIFITGEAGTGKTSLIDEFTLRSQESHPDLIVVAGNCNAHTGVGDPYLPFREILELLTGDVEARWLAGAIFEEYARFLWNLIPDSVQALIEVGPDLIGSFIPGEAIYQRALEFGSTDQDWLKQVEGFLRKTTTPAPGSFQQTDLFMQYSKVLQALAQVHPLMLVVDDLQWADLGSINLLFQLGRNLAGSRILIVGAYRPEEISLGRAGERHPLETVIHEFQRIFGDLTVDVEQVDGLDFIDALLDAEPNELDLSFRNLLFQQTGGHPLFTVELLRGMQERGDLLQNQQGEWTEGETLDWETLPARVEAVIAERISRLDPHQQALLRAASVEGEGFTAEVAAQALGRDPAQTLELLSGELDRVHRLVRAQSIQRLENQLISSYRFRHILVQKYLYNSLDEVERVHLHERIGSVLEELYTKREGTPTFALQLARHFQEARIPEQAGTYLLQAGERALNLSAYREAVEH